MNQSNEAAPLDAEGYPKDTLSPCPVKHWPDHPTHALRVVDNSQGEATPYTTLAFEFDGVMFRHENGEAVLQYVGDAIIKQWPLNSATSEKELVALQKAANVAIKMTTPPRDLLGPATADMKARADLGTKIAAAIFAIGSPQYLEGCTACNTGKKRDQNPYERGSNDSRTWGMGFDFEHEANVAD